MLRDELYSKIGLVGSLGLAILIPQKLEIESFSKCRDRYRASTYDGAARCRGMLQPPSTAMQLHQISTNLSALGGRR